MSTLTTSWIERTADLVEHAEPPTDPDAAVGLLAACLTLDAELLALAQRTLRAQNENRRAWAAWQPSVELRAAWAQIFDPGNTPPPPPPPPPDPKPDPPPPPPPPTDRGNV